MNGLVAVGLVTVGLLGGALLRPLGVDAQQSSFPFNPGDAVTIEYSDRSGFSHPCVIDRFYGSFITCKPEALPVGVPSSQAQKPFVYNLSTAISITLVNKAE
jgi:hypothetical protein